jgi:hypothetical protein
MHMQHSVSSLFPHLSHFCQKAAIIPHTASILSSPYANIMDANQLQKIRTVGMCLYTVEQFQLLT